MKIIRNKWKWEIEDEELLNPWFSSFPACVNKNKIKSNSERDVFLIKKDEELYFVKYIHPLASFQKLRSFLNPKAVSEYNSAKLLQKAGIPSIKYLGLGINGSKSILISKEITDSIDMRKYWFSNIPNNFELKNKVLAKFAEFLKKFLNSNLYHPDFHLGNIMIKENGDAFTFILIDPYGIVEKNNCSEKEKFKMLCIIGALRGEMKDDEAINFIKAFLDINDQKASELWNKILIAETRKTELLWNKRKSRILSDLRYSQVFENNNILMRIRKNFANELCLSHNDVLSLYNNYDENNKQIPMKSANFADLLKFEIFTQEEAENKWLNSFRLEFFRIPQNTPLAWIKKNKNEHILISFNDIQTDLSKKEIELRYKMI